MSTDLTTLCDEQKKQILNYERKLKDVVRAYKNLETEKKALEVALEAISGNVNTEVGESTEEKASDPNKSDTEESKIEALKQALTTLTVENKKKEMAFQSDRKAILVSSETILAEAVDGFCLGKK